MANVVLFVDDDDAFRMIVRRICGQIPAIERMIEATDGAEALVQLEAWVDADGGCPDVVFVDVNMPVLDGFGFLEKFESHMHLQ